MQQLASISTQMVNERAPAAQPRSLPRRTNDAMTAPPECPDASRATSAEKRTADGAVLDLGRPIPTSGDAAPDAERRILSARC
jgi:hypothetical protein